VNPSTKFSTTCYQILAQIANSTGKFQSWSQGGEAPDIYQILMFYWFEPVLYLYPVSTFPEATEGHGEFVGFDDNVGDKLTFKIL
jgi:hypothetical protein